MTAIEARGIHFSYGSSRAALADVSFTVERGAMHGFLGPNGSGKSTLFKILATILPLQQGDLRLLDLKGAVEKLTIPTLVEPTVTPTVTLDRHSAASRCTSLALGDKDHESDRESHSASGPQKTAGNGAKRVVGVTGLEPVTPSLSSWCSSQLS